MKWLVAMQLVAALAHEGDRPLGTTDGITVYPRELGDRARRPGPDRGFSQWVRAALLDFGTHPRWISGLSATSWRTARELVTLFERLRVEGAGIERCRGSRRDYRVFQHLPSKSAFFQWHPPCCLRLREPDSTARRSGG